MADGRGHAFFRFSSQPWSSHEGEAEFLAQLDRLLIERVDIQ
jgi:hypothetical protein